MLVSHSPPVFAHSPPTGSFLTEYTALSLSSDAVSKRAVRNSFRPIQHSNSWNTFPTRSTKKVTNLPIRPCLVIRSAKDSVQVEHSTSHSKYKKKVVFADDRGMALTHTRVMAEPSNVPPLWSYRFLSDVTQGLCENSVTEKEVWEITFPQPASDYVFFRKRLDTEKVSLENVIVMKSENIIQGTIKVKNETFEKEVFVRSSTNNWKTYEDSYCTFVASHSNKHIGPALILYDTFCFKIAVPPNSDKIEFCVCFKSGGNEYWDNNHGKNYVIVRKVNYLNKSVTNEHFQNERKFTSSETRYSEATQAKMELWSEFASWTHLENINPYW